MFEEPFHFLVQCSDLPVNLSQFRQYSHHVRGRRRQLTGINTGPILHVSRRTLSLRR